MLLSAFHPLRPGFFLSTSVETGNTPWSLTGSLLFNYMVCLGTSAVYHPTLTSLERTENALACFLLLDLAELCASDMARQWGVPKGRLWLAPQTQQNLQELCGCICIQTTTLEDGQLFAPFRSTELVLEQWFGYLRGQFCSSQFRTRDFLHASSKKSFQTVTKLNKKGPKMSDKVTCASKVVSDSDFIECCERALTSSLRLMAVCTEHLGKV